MDFLELISRPWPWYVSGPLIGLMVPVLLIAGNKAFGISSSLRHICAACIPSGIPFFKYNWKKEAWNLFLVTGVIIGAFLASRFFSNPGPLPIHPALQAELRKYGITNFEGFVPAQVFNWNAVLTVKGLILTVAGGFLVGFGTRYAGGCTSGHSITGLATLQWPSLLATCCFMAGGFVMANLILPYILQL